MRILVLSILLLVTLDSFGQVIRGRVLDAKTQKIIARASIYIEGSFKTTISDSSGRFALVSAISSKVPIIVSCVGYTSVKISEYSTEPIDVYLEPKTYHLNEVVVIDDGMTFEEKLAIFKKEFLGTSPSALACVIENEDDITFRYVKNRSLEAFSNQPLIVYNKELGYRVNYFLDYFMVIPGATALDGNAKFEEQLLGDTQDSIRVMDTRQNSYVKSRMYFIRCVWKNEVEKNNFRMYSPGGKRLLANDLIVMKDGLKYLRLPYPVRVVRDGFESVLTPRNRFTRSYIDENGYYDPSEITWTGAMAEQRVGDLLPFEY